MYKPSSSFGRGSLLLLALLQEFIPHSFKSVSNKLIHSIAVNILSENNWIKHCKNAPIIGRGTGAIVINITSSFQLIKLIEKMIPNITPIDVILELANKIFHNFNMYISKNILFVQHNLHKEKTIHNNFMNNSLKRINPNLGIISDFEPNIFE